MATGTIKKCDVCGVIHSPFKRMHWSDSIDHVLIDFKHCPAVQNTPFDGDICSNCARALCNIILTFIKEQKEKQEVSK